MTIEYTVHYESEKGKVVKYPFNNITVFRYPKPNVYLDTCNREELNKVFKELGPIKLVRVIKYVTTTKEYVL